MYNTKLTSKRQLTLPKKLRKIGLTGVYLEAKETPEGYLLRKQVSEDRFQEYVGILKRESNSNQIIKELRGECDDQNMQIEAMKDSRLSIFSTGKSCAGPSINTPKSR